MRHLFKAAEDIESGLGDRHFSNKKGETLEVSAAWAERILTAPTLNYEYIGEIPETPGETKQVAKPKKATKKRSKPKTATTTAKPSANQKKEPLAETIAEAKTNEGDTK